MASLLDHGVRARAAKIAAAPPRDIRTPPSVRRVGCPNTYLQLLPVWLCRQLSMLSVIIAI